MLVADADGVPLAGGDANLGVSDLQDTDEQINTKVARSIVMLSTVDFCFILSPYQALSQLAFSNGCCESCAGIDRTRLSCDVLFAYKEWQKSIYDLINRLQGKLGYRSCCFDALILRMLMTDGSQWHYLMIFHDVGSFYACHYSIVNIKRKSPALRQGFESKFSGRGWSRRL